VSVLAGRAFGFHKLLATRALLQWLATRMLKARSRALRGCSSLPAHRLNNRRATQPLNQRLFGWDIV
jgi:transposase